MIENVACVILNYNDSENTISLVKQIQNYDVLKYIIVVDNMSNDDSLIKINKLVSDKVSVWVSPRNGGYGYGNNFGVKIAKEKFNCEYAFIANPDVRFSEESAISALKCFELFPSCVLSSPIQLLKEGKVSKITGWDLPTVSNHIFSSLYFINKLVFFRKIDLSGTYIKKDCVAGAFLCIDIDKFLSVGGYDENLFLYYEETSIGFKFKKANYDSYIVANYYYYHYHGTGSTYLNIRNAAKRISLLLNSRMYVLKTYMTQSKPILLFASLCYKISFLEQCVISLIKSCLRILTNNKYFKY